MELYAPSTIRSIREKHGFKNSKSLGQNFLTDKNIIDIIISGTDITKNDLVIEIGPGMGVITAEAAKQARKVIAVEVDKNLIPILKETLEEYDNVEIINADILKIDINEIISKNQTAGGNAESRVRIIGNLPYYITTPIIMKILEEHVCADSITVMMQKEVADRIIASPGSKTYGAISVAVQYYCTIEHLCNVSKEVFVPVPKVDSTVLRFNIRKNRPVELTNEKTFFKCIRAGFGQRRKTLLNSLTGLLGCGKETVKIILETAGIDSARRAESLDLQDFARIANEFTAKGFE